MSDIQIQVLTLTKIKPKVGETSEAFTLRAVKKLHGLSNEAWEALPDPVQVWVNSNMLADEKGQQLELLTLSETESAEPEEPEAEAAEEPAEEETEEAPVEGEEKEPVVATKSAKKSAGKKAPAVKPAKKAAAPKAAAAATVKPAKAKSGETRGRKGAFPLDAKIKVLVDENPKRKGSASAKRFSKYADGKTVAELLKAGVGWNDLRWDSVHKHISIG